MKKLYKIFLIIFLIPVLYACSDEQYSLGEYNLALASVYLIGDNGYYLVLDNGTILYPEENNSYTYNMKGNQRVYINFTILSKTIEGYDYLVKINSIQNILTKPVIELTKENEDSIGNSPIKFLRGWIGDEYLNIEFQYKTGNNKPHLINMVYDSQENIKGNKVYLEFRHNNNGDAGYYSSKEYVAFDLRKLKEQNEDITDLIIKVRDFDTNKEYRIAYNQAKNYNILPINETLDLTQYN